MDRLKATLSDVDLAKLADLKLGIPLNTTGATIWLPLLYLRVFLAYLDSAALASSRPPVTVFLLSDGVGTALNRIAFLIVAAEAPGCTDA